MKERQVNRWRYSILALCVYAALYLIVPDWSPWRRVFICVAVGVFLIVAELPYLKDRNE